MKKLLVTLMVALFATVVLGQTKTEIKKSAIPKCIQEYVKLSVKDFNIDKVYKVDAKGVDNKVITTYQVFLSKGKEKQSLEFDKNCSSVKKLQTVPPTDPPKPLPPVKTGDEKKVKTGEDKK